MLHEQVQTHVLSEVVAVTNRLIGLWQGAWVDFGLESSLIGVARPSSKESWHWESFLHDISCILLWCLQQSLQVLVSWVILVTCLLPLVNRVTVPNTDIEESINQKNYIVLHRVNIKKHRLCLITLQRIAHESWLDHNQWIADILSKDHADVVLGLIRWGIKCLKEWRSS